MRRFAKPLYRLKLVPGVRIPPSPPCHPVFKAESPVEQYSARPEIGRLYFFIQDSPRPYFLNKSVELFCIRVAGVSLRASRAKKV